MGGAFCGPGSPTPAALVRAADVAQQYLDIGNAFPAGVVGEELTNSVMEVRDNAREVCASEHGAAQVARVLGFLVEAQSIDPSIIAAERQRQVPQDYRRFRRVADYVMKSDTARAGEMVQLIRDVDVVTDQWFGDHRTTSGAVSEGQDHLLRDVLADVQRVKAEGSTPVVVFDLDDTVFAPSFRTARILREFAETHRNLFRTPGQLRCVERLTGEGIVYSLATDLPAKCGVTEQIVVGPLMKYWFSKFFTNDYVTEDHPYGGAPAYVQALHEAGAMIVYFTGRQETGRKPGTEGGMRAGTVTALQREGFPEPNGNDVRLILKGTFEESDIDYKTNTVAQIGALGTVVAAFDNEPKMDGLFRTSWPQARVVNVGRCRAPNPTVSRDKSPDGKEQPPRVQEIARLPEGVERIMDYRTNGALVRAATPAGSKRASAR